MDPLESSTHSFIVKIWRERMQEQGRQCTWRGQITHVPSGERRAFTRLVDLTAFIVPYLERLGVSVTPQGRIKYWVQRRIGQWSIRE
jgi:hypothetical protein